MKKLLEEQLNELKKQFGDDIAVKIISTKKRIRIMAVVAKDGDEYDVPINKKSKASKNELNKTRNYIG